MCTVTYFPQPGGWMLTNNRDETPLRAANHLVCDQLGTHNIVYPPDEKGGSWIAVSSQPRVVSLLNGGFVKHAHRPPYRYSRGLLVLGAIRCHELKEYIQQTALDGIEPFTMVAKDPVSFVEWVWDGQQSHVRDLDPAQNHIWSSSTLYSEEQKEKRNRFFQDFISKSETIPENILHFHTSQPFGEPATDFLMDRPGVKSIAVTQVVAADLSVGLKYFNLLDQSTLVSKLSI